MKHLTLFELHQIIQRVFYLNFEHSVWIEAEISESRMHNGHVYLTLIEKNPEGQIVAKASASLWRNKAAMLKNRYRTVFDQVIKSGNQVKMLCQVEFHPQYGYSLQVQDFDPAYTEGFLFLEKKKTIDRLRKEELLDRNKTLELPIVIQKIAIISSATAAGFQDFVHQLTHNIHGYKFSWELFPSAMQGNKVEDQFPQAISAVVQRKDEFDVIVVVRGRGASVDLSYFDLYPVAKAVAQSPLPVIAGIGHERDESVTGMVSYAQVKTPTAAAEMIVDHNLKYESEIQQQFQSLRERAVFKIQNTRLQIQQSGLTIQHRIQYYIRQEYYHLENQMTRIRNSAFTIIQAEKTAIGQQRIWILENNPYRIMDRGYALVFQNNHRIRNLDQIRRDEPFDLVMNHQKMTVHERT
ncbi:MAG TPA: exodeoxyribonuclease VII large subunit [Membranihabitans sp.]|nr:exodeoxyribonuclease VII large subunit [Membranihabitans sp.]